MSGRVGKDQEVDGCHLSDHEAETHVLPSQTRELGEDMCRISVRSKDPDKGHDCYPAKTMRNSAYMSAYVYP